MLTDLRDKSQSFLILIMFGMLIVVFIFFFGPQAQGVRPGQEGAEDPGNWAAEVEGEEISIREVEIAVRRQFIFGGSNVDDTQLAQLRRDAREQVIDQAILEHRAHAAGIFVSAEEVSRYLSSRDNPDFVLFRDQKGNFSYDRFQAQVGQGFGASPDVYRRAKARELVVDRYLRFLASQVRVAEPEVKAAFELASRTWDLEYIVVDPVDYTHLATAPTAAEGTAYAAAHTDAVKTYYDKNKKTYDHSKEVKVRRVLLKMGKGKSEAKVKAAAETAHAAAIADGANFVEVVKAHSEGFYKDFGGDMGWQSEGNTAPADYKVLSTLEAGQISAVTRSPIGFWFSKVEDVKPAVKKSLEDVSGEIGVILARDDARRQAARAAAEGLLAKAKTGTTFEALTVVPKVPPVALEEGVPVPAVVPQPKFVVRTTGTFGGDRPAFDVLPGIGKSPALAKMLDTLTMEKPLVEQVVDAGQRLAIVHLKARAEPSAEDYTKRRGEFEDRLRSQRAGIFFGRWREVVFGPVAQRDVFRKFGGGALLASLPVPGAANPAVKLNEAAFPMPKAPAKKR